MTTRHVPFRNACALVAYAYCMVNACTRAHKEYLSAIPKLMNELVFTDILKSRIKVMLFETFEAQAPTHDRLYVQKAPTRGVFCTIKMKVGSIKLVPFTINVMMATSMTSAVAKSALAFGHEFSSPNGGSLYGFLAPPRLVLSEDKDALVVPYWIVRTTPDSAQGNCEYSTVKIIGSDKIAYNVPILTNSRALNVDEELVLYKPLTLAGKRDAEGAKASACCKGKGKGGKGKGKTGRSIG